ncbi:MAG: RNase P subunit p30 family protein [Candidatus Nezhaarchaeota archaeon]|nr:RNase P subunit p30 family protein [Candidatus Nezhaarchaeota archaeon]
MRRRYVELEASVNVDLGLLRHLGWGAVAIATERLTAEPTVVKRGPSGLTVARRLNLAKVPRRGELVKARNLFEVVAIKPLNIEEARAAARSGLVDLISLPSGPKCFNEGVASLMESSGVLLELRLSPLISAGCPSHLLAVFRRWYLLAKEKRVGVVFSTGASSPLEARSPRDLVALASLITLNLEEAARALSNTPWTLIEQGSSRLGRYLMPGVRVVEG